MRRQAVSAAIAVVATFAMAAKGGIASAQSAKARADDRAAVTACLALVQTERKRQTEAQNKAQAEESGDKPEVIDAAKWLSGAGARAAADETSCIGVVSTPCQETAEGRSNVGSADCMRREYAVWDERLNKAHKDWTTGCDDKRVCEARRKSGRAWLAARDARCALPEIEFQGSMAIPATSFCLLDETAHRAIWLESALQ